MAVPTDARDSGDTIDRLAALRLDRDWSYRQLSDDMARVGVRASQQTLHQILNDRSLTPYDRTLHKIRVYLDTLDAERSGKRRRKSGRAA
jgi:transcriptional regulator with XRE-family HTH domain